MITSGVRQVPSPGPEDALMPPVIAAMCFPWSIGARHARAKCDGELMQLHENPKGRGGIIFRCKAALQN
jgi:hypothetical protein